jgi:3-oxoacyl-[acyl-carrier protein] reductase
MAANSVLIMSDTQLRTVLVTGASRGIGRAIALRLGREGYAVVVHYGNNELAAQNVAEEIRASGAQARAIGFDIADRATVADRLEADVESHGAYYGVVCNAGVVRDAAFPMMSGDDWDFVLRTNLDGFYNVLNPIIMPMIRQKAPGRIVAITSVSGITGNRGQANYSASKAGIIGAAKTLAIELAKRKITVNCVAPGLISTDMVADLPQEQILKMIPMQRIGSPEEVAGVVAFLCSDDAAYITRQVIAVDGGIT